MTSGFVWYNYEKEEVPLSKHDFGTLFDLEQNSLISIGNKVTIIRPLSLRQKMINKYKAGLNDYREERK